MSFKFSIIVPVYNVEEYLEEAIESLLSQSYRDFEIILVNDGSTDKSGEICKSYSEKYDFVHFLEQENQGQSVARNQGVKLAKGDAIYFFDADDVLTSNSLKEWSDAFVSSDCDAILFNASVFGDNIDKTEFKPEYSRNVSHESVSGAYYLEQSIKDESIFVSPCCYVARTHVIKSLSFQPKIKHEDELYYILLLALKVSSIRVLDKVYFNRRVRPGSTMTASSFVLRQHSYLTVFNELKLRFGSLDTNLNKLIMERASRCYFNSLFLPKQPKFNLEQRANLVKMLRILVPGRAIKLKLLLLYLIPDLKVLVKRFKNVFY